MKLRYKNQRNIFLGVLAFLAVLAASGVVATFSGEPQAVVVLEKVDVVSPAAAAVKILDGGTSFTAEFLEGVLGDSFTVGLTIRNDHAEKQQVALVVQPPMVITAELIMGEKKTKLVSVADPTKDPSRFGLSIPGGGTATISLSAKLFSGMCISGQILLPFQEPSVQPCVGAAKLGPPVELVKATLVEFPTNSKLPVSSDPISIVDGTSFQVSNIKGRIGATFQVKLFIRNNLAKKEGKAALELEVAGVKVGRPEAVNDVSSLTQVGTGRFLMTIKPAPSGAENEDIIISGTLTATSGGSISGKISPP